jgi:glutaredoxin
MIEIYGKTQCSFCTSAKQLCELYRLEHKYYSLNTDYSIEELWDKVKFKTFPQIFVDGECIGGFSELLEYTDGS